MKDAEKGLVQKRGEMRQADSHLSFGRAMIVWRLKADGWKCCTAERGSHPFFESRTDLMVVLLFTGKTHYAAGSRREGLQLEILDFWIWSAYPTIHQQTPY